MICKDGYEIHPLRQSRVTIGNDIVFELNKLHQRSWFILDLATATGNVMFVPQDAEEFITSDEFTFCSKEKRT